jgi:flap endonuclease-1
MGIKGLMKMIKCYAPNAINECNYISLSGSIVALDILLTMYKFIIAIRNGGSDMETNNGKMKSHLYGLLLKIDNMLRYGIIPVAVFDGKPPIIKKEALRDRYRRKKEAIKKFKLLKKNHNKYNTDNEKMDSENEQIKFYKRSYNITEICMNDAKKLIEMFGFLSIQAPEEADSQCAALCKSEFVDAVVTEDMDVLAFGTNKMWRSFSSKNKVLEINLNTILTDMKITKEQFIDICIILGTEYCKPIKGIEFETIYKKYIPCNNMEEFIEFLNKENAQLLAQGEEIKYFIPKNFLLRWKMAKDYYLSSASVIDPMEFVNNANIDYLKDNRYYWSKPNKQKILDFLCKEHDFNINQVTQIVDYAIKRQKEYIKNGYIMSDKTEINNRHYGKNIKYTRDNFVVLGKPLK